MKKLFILVLLALVGIGLIIPNLKADEARTQPHKFRAFAESTAVAQGATIFRISGVATGNNAVFGVYNSATLGGTAVTVCAIEGGEATSGDPIRPESFGSGGLTLDTGMSVVVSNCTIVIEYL